MAKNFSIATSACCKIVWLNVDSVFLFVTSLPLHPSFIYRISMQKIIYCIPGVNQQPFFFKKAGMGVLTTQKKVSNTNPNCYFDH